MGQLFAGKPSIRRADGPQSKTWDGFTYGPEVGTYHAKLNFVVAGQWAVAIRFQRDSIHPLERIDWMQDVSTNDLPRLRNRMRHFYRTHLVARRRARARRTSSFRASASRRTRPRRARGPTPGRSARSSSRSACRGRALHLRAGRDRSDGREPPRPQREEVFRRPAPHEDPSARARGELLTCARTA